MLTLESVRQEKEKEHINLHGANTKKVDTDYLLARRGVSLEMDVEAFWLVNENIFAYRDDSTGRSSFLSYNIYIYIYIYIY